MPYDYVTTAVHASKAPEVYRYTKRTSITDYLLQSQLNYFHTLCTISYRGIDYHSSLSHCERKARLDELQDHCMIKKHETFTLEHQSTTKRCVYDTVYPWYLEIQHSPGIFKIAVLYIDMGRRKYSLVMFVSNSKTTIPTSILLKNLYNITKLKLKERIVRLVRIIAVHNCRSIYIQTEYLSVMYKTLLMI